MTDARSLAMFLGLAAFAAGVAMAARREVSGVDAPEGEGADWWRDPLGTATDAADSIDSIEGLFVKQQSLSTVGLQLLKELEGFSPYPYPDHKGYSIGYGHLIRPGEDLAYVTQAQAEQLLRDDVAWAERAVRVAVRVPLSQSQFDALVSLAYNIGASAFRLSTLVRKLNAGDYAGAAGEFQRWNMAGGAVLDALVRRRDAERNLFEA